LSIARVAARIVVAKSALISSIFVVTARNILTGALEAGILFDGSKTVAGIATKLARCLVDDGVAASKGSRKLEHILKVIY
jgi:hypothetical protein